MAALSTQDRIDMYAQFMRDVASDDMKLPGVLKADLLAMFNAIDDWGVANASSFNNALPATAKAALPAAVKARALAAVVLKRYQKGA
jgi:hypothetical protein